MTIPNHRLGWALAAAAGVVIFAAFCAWGGIPAETNVELFWLQASLFLLVMAAFVLVFWHLFVRPLAPNLRAPQKTALPLRARESLALVLASGGAAIYIGAVWDEIWHRVYGIPFGEDLFWRPHLLMYFGFGAAVVCGCWALLHLNRHLRGNFQQRFRSNPIVGALILNAAFLLYALPADPLWHWIFGEDITAWSVPHLILLTSFVLTQLLALNLYVSSGQQTDWQHLFKLRPRDGLALLILAGISMLWLQLMLIDWDATLVGVRFEWLGLYRPEWLLAANLMACVVFTGVIATRVLRCAGAATAIGLIALLIRVGLIELFQTDLLQYVAWVAALLPLLAIDIWAYYCYAIRKQEPEWRGTAAAVIVAMAANAVVIRSLYNLADQDNLAYAAAIIVTGLGMSWLANQTADAMLRQPEATAQTASAPNRVRLRFSYGIVAAFVAFAFVFIVTAAPPM